MSQGVENQRVVSLHLTNSFIRNLTFNFSYIYINSILISKEGAQSFSKLFLFASVLSVLVYSLFLFLRPRRVTTVYIAILGSLIFIASFFYFSGENNSVLLYMLGAGIYLSDLISPNIAASNIQHTTHQFFFREIYSKVVLNDLKARVLSSVLILAINQYSFEFLVFPVFLVLLVLTFVNSLMIQKILPKKMALFSFKDVLKNTQESVFNFFTNKFLLFTICIVIWSTMSKFIVELIFYERLNDFYLDTHRISSFMSLMNLVVIFSSLIFQKFVAVRFLNSWTLSSLFSLLPSVVFAGAALSLAPTGLVGVVLFQGMFLIVNKSIQIPTGRQCLLIVPEHLRHYSAYVQSILITLSGIFLSSFCQLIKNQWSYSHYVLLVVGVTTPIFIIISRMDQYYVYNVWNQLRKKTADLFDFNLSDDVASVSLTAKKRDGQFKELVSDGTYSTNIKYFIYDLISMKDGQVVELLRAYYNSYDFQKINKIIDWHKGLFVSTKIPDVKKSLALCEMLGVRCFDEFLKKFTDETSNDSLRREAEIILLSNKELSKYHFSNLSLVTQFKFRYLFAKHMQRNDSNMILGLKHLIKNPDRNTVSLFVDILSESRFHNLRPRIEECLHNSYGRLTLLPLIESFLLAESSNSSLAQHLLELIPGGSYKKDIQMIVERFLLKSKESMSLDQFLKLMYLEEWCLSPESDSLRKSALVYFHLKEDERLLFKELHLEFLKKSRYFKCWRPLILQIP